MLAETVEGVGRREQWLLEKRDFGKGCVEVCARRVTVWDTVGQPRERGRRGQSEGEARAKSIDTAERRAKKLVRLKTKALGADRLLSLTTREAITDRKRFQALFEEFVRRCRRNHINLTYVAVPELQRRGALHLHLAIHGYVDVRQLRAIWLCVVRDEAARQGLEWTVGGKGMGNVDITQPARYLKALRGQKTTLARVRHALAAYLCKYVSKSFHDDEAFDAKRYWSTRGIPVPEKTQEGIGWDGDDMDAAEAIAVAFRVALANGPLQHVRYFWNEGLGVFWIATGEGPPHDGVPF